jgi:hypothetical protein
MVKLRVMGEYKRSDIPTIPIPPSLLSQVKEWAIKMDRENHGRKTRDGGDYKDVKGCLGQWGVHQYLVDNKWSHSYSPPYVKEQYGDQYDIKFCGEIWDVKCREWWNEDYYYNIKIKMGEHEKTEAKPCDSYIFTTTDKEYNNIYILGAIPYHNLWNELQPLDDISNSMMKFPCAGSIPSRNLIPIRDFILRA